MKLKVIAADWCPHCRRCINFLRENNIEFEYIDIDENPGIGDELEWRIGMKRIPMFIIGSEWISPCDPDGWSKEKTKKILEKYGIAFIS